MDEHKRRGSDHRSEGRRGDHGRAETGSAGRAGSRHDAAHDPAAALWDGGGPALAG